MNETLFLVMPAYNEEANIEDVIREWHPICEQVNAEGNTAKLIIANDGSKDSTYSKMLELQPKYCHLVALDKKNSGHGATVMYLYRYAIQNGADYVFQTDSDGQTKSEEFWQMWKNRSKYDFQIGTRGERQDGISRVFVTKTLRLIVWMMFHVWVKDANTPFRLMKTDKLASLLKLIPNDFFLANVAISAAIVKRRESLAWYPITFRPRQGGKNSINMRRIFSIGFHAISDFYSINKEFDR